MTATPGTVYLVGAGPGDPGLLTVRGELLLGAAGVVVYDGLASPAVLARASDDAEKIYAGKKHSERGGARTQDEINAILIDRARAGKVVVRLKGGDPFVFGRGGEEASALVLAGVPFEVVPGVTAATAVPAYAGIPLTHRGAAHTAVVLSTGHDSEGQLPADIDWSAIARIDTLVLFMAVTTLPEIAQRLVAAGRASTTPVAVIRWGTTAAQRTVTGTLADIAARVDAAGLKPPALVVVGDVVALREQLAWFDRRPLFGVRVLVPREKDQAWRLVQALAALGADPVVVPVTRTEPGDMPALDQAIARLPGGYAWVALASGRAVDVLMFALHRAGRDTRALAGVRVAAVGKSTAEVLRRYCVQADMVPAKQDAAGLAAAMNAAFPLRGAGVLVPRAQEGREELVEALIEARAAVTSVAAYRTVPIPAAELEPTLARLRAAELDVLTFFAPSQVAALCDALGEGAAATLSRARLVAAIGDTTAAALRGRGVRVDVVSPTPSAEALATAIRDHYPRPTGTEAP